MKNFFKGIGKAILYVVGFPFLIVALALACAVTLFIFLFQFGKLVFLFFTGRNLFSDLEEDRKAKEIIERNSIINEKRGESLNNSQMDLYPSNSPVYGTGYSSPLVEENKPDQVVPSEVLDEANKGSGEPEISLLDEEDKFND